MAENTDKEQLLYSIEVRLNDLEKGMNKAQGTANAAYREMKKASGSATKQMAADAERSTKRINQALATTKSEAGGLAKAFAGGFMGGIAGGLFGGGLTGLYSGLRSAAKGIAEIGDEAKRAGLNVKEFQEWKYVFEQNRIGIDAMVDGFKELSLRADEYIQTGKGSAAESFQRLGMSPEEVKERIKNPSDLMLELIDRTRRLGDKAASIRIWDELLGGTGGEKFVQLIDQGRDGLEQTKNQAQALGKVLDEDTIKAAAELDKKFSELAANVEGGLKRAIVNSYEVLTQLLALLPSAENASKATLQKKIDYYNNDSEIARSKIGRWQGRYDKTYQDIIDDNQKKIDEYKARLAEIDKLEEEQRAKLSKPIDQTPVTPYVPPKTEKTKKSGRSSEPKLDDYERLTKSIQERIAVLNEEKTAQSQINPLMNDYGFAAEKASWSQKLLNAALKSGRTDTSALREEVDKLATEYAGASVEAKRLADVHDQIRDRAQESLSMARDFTGGLIQGFIDGKNAGEAFGDVLKNIGNQLLNMGLEQLFNPQSGIGSGLSGGGFGSLFSGIGKLFGFATGTANTGGARGQPMGIVHGQEAVIPLPNGGKVPVQLSGGQSASAAAPAQISIQVQSSEFFDVKVQQIAGNVATDITKNSIESYDKNLDATLGQKIANGRSKNRYGFL